MQKQTKIKMNDIYSPKLGGGSPTAPQLWGQVAPTAALGSRVPKDRMEKGGGIGTEE